MEKGAPIEAAAGAYISIKFRMVLLASHFKIFAPPSGPRLGPLPPSTAKTSGLGAGCLLGYATLTMVYSLRS